MPDVVDNVLGVASAEPGAILYEASEKLREGATGVYEYIRMIEDQMEKAVRQCLLAAAHQFSIDSQKKLLKAAALGKSLLRRLDASQFVDICRVIRVLNSVRKPYVGLALSFAQCEELKMNCLVDRLIDLGHWPLAIAICRYIKEPSKKGIHRVLAHWSLKKVTSFTHVAMKAADANLNELAEFLLEKETHLSRQVEMLLKLNKPERALAKAARSQKPDLRKQPVCLLNLSAVN
ncbi:unnamed protein product, partial [Gongylonema pulchrum]|uniref:Vacuolar protein sorting-associated protein 16 homolog n=1 Tax=Gongylonema pulchrum TaxID=637853 RepID=A0A183EG31_9BILA